jgi:hypothetical protein
MPPEQPSAMPVPRATRTWIRALAAWSVCFVGAALALELIVLALDTGEWSPAVLVMIAAATILGVAGGAAVWRLVGRALGRPRLAAGFVLAAAGWAGLGALVMAWLFAAFRP